MIGHSAWRAVHLPIPETSFLVTLALLGSVFQTRCPVVDKEIQSARFALNLPSKCKNCTLEEMAILRIVQANPRVTQKEMASEIGKSERTLKTITVSLQEKGLLRRVGGKKDGRWEVVGEE